MKAPGLLHEDRLSALPNLLDAPMDKCEDPFSHQEPMGGLKERGNVKGKTGQIYLLTTRFYFHSYPCYGQPVQKPRTARSCLRLCQNLYLKFRLMVLGAPTQPI